MGERYKSWMAGQDSAQILNGFGVGSLNEEQQELLEQVYWMTGRPSQENKRPKRIKQLSEMTGLSTAVISSAVEFLGNLNFTASTKSGEDPHVYEGDQHRKGLSRPQSRG